MLPALFVCALLLLTRASVAYQRPIDDFLSTQGTEFGGAYVLWTDPAATDGADLASLDYAGLDDKTLVAAGFPSLGTTMTGMIEETPQPDGTAEVHVVLNTRQALAWSSFLGITSPSPLPFPGHVLFGNTLDEVLSGAPAILGAITLEIRFVNTAPHAPMPDLVGLFFAPAAGQVLESIGVQADAHGLLASGSPGHLAITQKALLLVPDRKPPFYDYARVEHILLKPTGN